MSGKSGYRLSNVRISLQAPPQNSVDNDIHHAVVITASALMSGKSGYRRSKVRISLQGKRTGSRLMNR